MQDSEVYKRLKNYLQEHESFKVGTSMKTIMRMIVTWVALASYLFDDSI